MPVIGPLTLKIMASAEAMTSALGRASATVDSFVTANARKFAGLSKALNGGVAGGMRKGQIAANIMGGVSNVAAGAQKALGDPGRFLAENIIGGLATIASKIPKVGGLLALPLELTGGLLSFAMDQFEKGAESLTALGAASARTGISMGDLRAVMIAAGPAADQMDKAMFRFQKHVMDAQRGSIEAKGAFYALGISTEGIASRNTLDLLKEIADKFAKLPDGAAKSAAAFALFGRAGFAMMPMLAEGRSRLEKGQSLAERFGLGGDQDSVKLIKQAQQAKKTMALFAEGVTNQITLGVAPVLATLAEYMDRFGVSTKGVSAYVIDALEAIAMAGAAVYTGFANLGLLSKTLWLGFKIGCEYAAVAILDFGAYALEAMGKVVKKMAELGLMMMSLNPATKAMFATLKATTGVDVLANMKKAIADSDAPGAETARKMRAAAERGRKMIAADKTNLLDSWLAPNAMDKVRGFFDTVRAKAASAGKGLSDPLSEALATWGPKIQEIARQLDGPLGVFREKVGEINAIWKTGLLNFDPSFRLQAIGAQTQSLLSGMQTPEKRFAGAAAFGSTDAYSAIVQHAYGDQNKGLQERLLDAALEQKARAADQVRIGEETLEFLRSNPGVIMSI